MPKTEGDPLGPEFERRLRGELDRVRPPFSSPRYLARGGRPIALRVAPAVLALSLVGILGLSAYAATGSPNPVVWTEHVVTVIHPNPASPTPSPTTQQNQGGPAATPGQDDNRHGSPRPTERPEPSESPEPSGQPSPNESPEPSGDHSGEGSGGDSGDALSGGGSGDSGSGTDDSHNGSD